ncbi:MAG: ABC transporter permease [Desulfurococcales archaeon]|nr:ABC transporter permease [Desulfurococcales archaeon]
MKVKKMMVDTYIILVINFMSMRTAIIPYIVIAIILPLGFTYLVSLAFKNMITVEAATNMLVGVIVLSLSLSIINGIGQNLGQDRLLKRLELIASYPVSPGAYILGVSTVFIVSSLINISVMVFSGGAAWNILDRVLHVFPQLLALSLTASLGLIGIGAVIGTRSSNLPQTYALTNIVSFTIAMLTPAYYPIEIMPSPIRLLSQFIPTTHAALIARSLLGVGQYDIEKHTVLLVLLTSIYLLIGFRGIKWYEE